MGAGSGSPWIRISRTTPKSAMPGVLSTESSRAGAAEPDLQPTGLAAGLAHLDRLDLIDGDGEHRRDQMGVVADPIVDDDARPVRPVASEARGISYWACETLDMLKSGTRSAGVAAREK